MRCHTRAHSVLRILASTVLATIILLLWLSGLATGGPEKDSLRPPSVVGQLIDGVSSSELQAHICHLQDRDALGYCNTQGSRYARDAQALQEAATYISDQLAQRGLSVTLDPFPLPPGVTGRVITNVIATLEGVAPPEERQVLILSAHYDSIAANTPGWQSGDPAPGADDNASGVAAVLEAARLFSSRRFYHTVRFILFAGEELGLYGSQHYARQAHARGEAITGVINLDMIGYETDGDPRFEIHAGLNPRAIHIAQVMSQTVAAYGLDLRPQVLTTQAIGLSDHESFWELGFPALLLIEDTELRGPTQDWNPYYHTVQDTLDKLNTPYMRELTRAAVGTLAHLARPVAPDLQVHLAGPHRVASGSRIGYTLTYTNTGIERASNVVITSTLSNGLVYEGDTSGRYRSFGAEGSIAWQIGDLAAGQSGSFVITASVMADLPVGAQVFNRVTIASTTLDADAADNLVELRATIRPPWHLYLPLLANP